MILNISQQIDDEANFIANLEGLVSNLVSELEPQLVYVVRVNKWFDHKWLRYSGKGRVGFEGRPLVNDTALDSFWQDELTFPPFNPNQIGEQEGWGRTESNSYKALTGHRPPHGEEKGHSSANLQNRVRRYSNSGVFVWFSSHSNSNKRASIMVYSVEGEAEDAWYASFGSQPGWVVDRVKGINRERVQRWLSAG